MLENYRVWEMFQHMNVPAAKLDNLSLTPVIHMVDGKN